jgi:hypothetical protein
MIRYQVTFVTFRLVLDLLSLLLVLGFRNLLEDTAFLDYKSATSALFDLSL